MKRIPLITLSLFLALLFVAVGVYAQGDDTETLDENNSASLSIVETVPVTASLEVNLNGQIYILAIPATLNIDAQKDLAEALLIAQEVDTVGDVQWQITDIVEYEEEFGLTDFTTLEPSSPDNKLVVVESEVTNLDTEPFVYYLTVNDLLAYDDLGNLFDPIDYSCDDINPGDMRTCRIVFDVPKTTTILGLDLKVIEHKQIPHTAQE